MAISIDRGYEPPLRDEHFQMSALNYQDANVLRVENDATQKRAEATFTVLGTDPARRPSFRFIRERQVDAYANSQDIAEEARVPSKEGAKCVFITKEIWKLAQSHGDLADYQVPVTLTTTIQLPLGAFSESENTQAALDQLILQHSADVYANISGVAYGAVDVRNS